MAVHCAFLVVSFFQKAVWLMMTVLSKTLQEIVTQSVGVCSAEECGGSPQPTMSRYLCLFCSCVIFTESPESILQRFREQLPRDRPSSDDSSASTTSEEGGQSDRQASADHFASETFMQLAETVRIDKSNILLLGPTGSGEQGLDQ